MSFINTMPGDIISLYRARLAREKGGVRKDWGGRLSVALAFPNYYRLGMSNLGFQLVYRLLNERSDVVAERVFLPDVQEMPLYLSGRHGLLSLESQIPLQEFHLVAFSLSFENDYPNVLTVLELGKIPLFAEKRSESCPLIMAGGITTFLNPEPLAPFMDFFLMGEAEGNLNEFMALFEFQEKVHKF
ncbi:MAG: radical SAM protein, partial [Thermodesulfobacteriota bacterium]|nr:radical SAM protein [Thermodesulfobacteriota bacterium]